MPKAPKVKDCIATLYVATGSTHRVPFKVLEDQDPYEGLAELLRVDWIRVPRGFVHPSQVAVAELEFAV